MLRMNLPRLSVVSLMGLLFLNSIELVTSLRSTTGRGARFMRSTTPIAKQRYRSTSSASSSLSSSSSSSEYPLFTSTAGPNITSLFQMHTMGLWFTSVSLVASSQSTIGLDYLTAGGDWDNPPYFFYLASGSMDTGALYYNITNIDPGNVWPRQGLTSYTGYSGIDFTTFTTNFDIFTSSSGIPVWSTTVNEITDNVWETGPSITLSTDNQLVTTAVTLVPNDNPLGTKFASLTVVNVSTTPFPTTIFTDYTWPNATGFELLHVSDDGQIVVMVSAIQNNDGSIHTSLVRIYNIFLNLTLSSFITPYAFTGCLSPDGHYLVLGTTDSEDRIDVYYINTTTVTPIVNSSYPASLPGTFQYIATCRVNNNGLLMSTFAIFWGDAMNQTVIGSYQLTNIPMNPPLSPIWLYSTLPTSDTLQDTPEQDCLIDDIYLYSSWGGTTLNGTAATPTLHIYNVSLSNGPIAEIITVASPSGGGPNISGSLGGFDVAYPDDGTNDLIIIAEGQDGHANIGSYSGAVYSWRLHFP